MASVEHLCQKAIVLDRGKLIFSGSAGDAIEHYLHGMPEATGGAAQYHIIDLSAAPGRLRTYRPILKRLELFADGRPLNGAVKIGAPFRARVVFGLEKPTINFDVALAFDNHLGQRVFTASTAYQPNRPEIERVGEQMIVCDIPSLPFAPGDYRIKVFFAAGPDSDRVEDAARFTVTGSDYYGTGKVPSDCVFVLPHQWYVAEAESR
jgi:hypothetical protein